LPKDGRENQKLWLFEMLAYNLPRVPERGSDFFTYIASNPLKRLDSKKQTLVNASKFTSV
jgi:hypothetical protein